MEVIDDVDTVARAVRMRAISFFICDGVRWMRRV